MHSVQSLAGAQVKQAANERHNVKRRADRHGNFPHHKAPGAPTANKQQEHFERDHQPVAGECLGNPDEDPERQDQKPENDENIRTAEIAFIDPSAGKNPAHAPATPSRLLGRQWSRRGYRKNSSSSDWSEFDASYIAQASGVGAETSTRSGPRIATSRGSTSTRAFRGP